MTDHTRKVKRLSILAQHIRLLGEAKGITSTKALAAEIDVTERAIWKAKAELRAHDTLNDGSAEHVDSTLNNGSVQTERSFSPSLNDGSAEQKEIPPKPPKEKYIPTVENPTHVEFEAAREVCLGDGVFADERTIRHRDFTISLPGLLMGVQASGASSDEVRAFAVAQALQWAAELAAGGDRRTILPARMANALAASFMHAHNRAQIHGTRVEAAKTVVPFPARQPEPQRRGLMDEIRARRAAREQAEAAALATGGAA